MKRVMAGAAVLAVALAVTGCAQQRQYPTPTVDSNNAVVPTRVYEQVVTLEDGRLIVCLIAPGSGVSCDWENVESTR